MSLFEILSPESDLAARLTANEQPAEILSMVLVTEIDRIGGQFVDNNNGNPAPIFSIKGRRLDHVIDSSGAGSEKNMYMETFFPLFDVSNFDLPERGEIVWVIYNSTNTRVKQGYWLGKRTPPFTPFIQNQFTRNTAGDEFGTFLPEEQRYGGKKPATIDYDYDISPDPLYDPFPQFIRFKPGDKATIGRSNTRLQHSFDAEVEANKRGYIEIATECVYIQNDPDKHRDLFIDTEENKNQFLNSLGSRIFIGTQTNIIRNFIYKDTEKDGAGKFGNVQKVFDKHFIEEVPTPPDSRTAKNKKKIGTEIVGGNIQDDASFSPSADDVIHVETKKRNDVSFDEFAPGILLESGELWFISKRGGAINHAVLGEELVRLLERCLMDNLYLSRTLDIVRDLLQRLSVDFLQHNHPAVPGQTLQPVGSPYAPSPLEHQFEYLNSTKGSVGSDTKQFDESGIYSPMNQKQVKNRIAEYRTNVVARINELSSILSNHIALN